MVYVVKFKNGTVKTIEKTDLASLDVDAVEVVYPGTLEVEVVTELVPQGEEEARFKETVAVFREKYRGKVVSEKGLIDFETWFASASTGDRALVPERVLVPVKTYRILKVKGEKKMPVPRQSPVPAEVAALSGPLTPEPTPKPEKKPVYEKVSEVPLPKPESVPAKKIQEPMKTPIIERKKEIKKEQSTRNAPKPAPLPAPKKKKTPPARRPSQAAGKKK